MISVFGGVFRGLIGWGVFSVAFGVWWVFLRSFLSRLLLNSTCTATELLEGWFPGVFRVLSGVCLLSLVLELMFGVHDLFCLVNIGLAELL